MRINKIIIVYLKEIKEILRDKKALFMMVVIPLILYPLALIGTGYFSGEQILTNEKYIPHILILNSDKAPEFISFIKSTNEYNLIDSSDPELLLKNSSIQLCIKIPENYSINNEDNSPVNLIILYDEANSESIAAKQKFIKHFEIYRNSLIKTQLSKNGIKNNIIENFTVEEKNIASSQKVGAFLMSKIMPFMILILAFTGAMHNAITVTAGEKQRQTIETILVSAIRRKEIVLGKFLTIFSSSIITAFLGLISLFITFKFGFYFLSETSSDYNISISLSAVLIMFIMIIPIAAIFSAILFMLGSVARTNKEAEMYSSAFLMIIFALSSISLVPNYNPSVKLFLIPIMNTTLLQKELLMLNFNYLHIVLTICTSVILAFSSLLMATRLFSREEILFRT